MWIITEDAVPPAWPADALFPARYAALHSFATDVPSCHATDQRESKFDTVVYPMR